LLPVPGTACSTPFGRTVLSSFDEPHHRSAATLDYQRQVVSSDATVVVVADPPSALVRLRHAPGCEIRESAAPVTPGMTMRAPAPLRHPRP
jgi:hypothetical protein